MAYQMDRHQWKGGHDDGMSDIGGLTRDAPLCRVFRTCPAGVRHKAMRGSHHTIYQLLLTFAFFVHLQTTEPGNAALQRLITTLIQFKCAWNILCKNIYRPVTSPGHVSCSILYYKGIGIPEHETYKFRFHPKNGIEQTSTTSSFLNTNVINSYDSCWVWASLGLELKLPKKS